METTYYTLTAREILAEGGAVEQASGGARQLVCVRRAGRPAAERDSGKVIDLAAWRAAREEETRLEELRYEGAPGVPEAPAASARPRARRDRRRAVLFWGELLATLSVAAVMAALLAQILG